MSSGQQNQKRELAGFNALGWFWMNREGKEIVKELIQGKWRAREY